MLYMLSAFQATVRAYYAHHGRDLPWRPPTLSLQSNGQLDPYAITVSELMLQQTQVTRVIPKYQAFLQTFPNWDALAQAPLSEVLRAWSGLGYNRRAKYLWQTAQRVTGDHHGQLPQDRMELQKLPGIGPNTAGAIVVYAFDQPAVFVETNIRTVFLHHFFQDQIDVPDAAILKLVEQTLDRHNPRTWFWGLMDYGAYLKVTAGAQLAASKHYTKQSTFHGSRRQLRGQIIRLLTERSYSRAELQRHLPDSRLPDVLSDLVAEQLVKQIKKGYALA